MAVNFKRDLIRLLFLCVYLIPIIILISGYNFARFVENSVESKNLNRIKAEISKHLTDTSLDIKSSLELYVYGLNGLHGAIKSVGADNFSYQHNLSYFKHRNYPEEFPGARGFGFIKKIDLDQVDSFVEEMKLSKNGDFAIKTIDETWDNHFIIQFIEPEDNNKQAVGLDIASEENRRLAAIHAAISKTVQLTAPITLVQAEEKIKHGFLLLKPVFYDQQESVSQGELAGWVYAPLLIDEIISSIQKKSPNFEFTIEDIAPDDKVNFYNPKNLSATNNQSLQKIQFELFGRSWQVTAHPNQAYIDSLYLNNPHTKFIEMQAFAVLICLFVTIVGIYLIKQYKTYRDKIELAAIVKNAMEGIIGLDSSFCVKNWNDRAASLIGLKTSDRNKPILNLIKTNSSTENLLNIFKKVTAGEAVQHFSIEMNLAEKILHLELNFMPLNQNGKFIGATLSIVDVTKLVGLQSELQCKNKKLEASFDEQASQLSHALSLKHCILNNSEEAIIVTNAQGHINLFNKRSEDILGYHHEEVLGESIVETLFDSSYFLMKQDSVVKQYNLSFKSKFDVLLTVFDHETNGQAEWQLLNKAGNSIELILTSAEVKDDNLNLLGYVFKLKDLTKDKLLEQSFNMIQASVDNSEDILFWISRAGQILKYNPYALVKLGYTDAQLKNISVRDIIDISESDWNKIWLNLSLKNRASIECNYKLANLDKIPMLLAICYLNINAEEIVYISAKNIADRIEKEALLNKALAEATYANEAKIQFLANMSHQIRTPLHAASGMMQLIELTELDPEQLNYVTDAKHSLQNVTYIIDDILDLTQAEKGHLEILPKEFDIFELFSELGSVLTIMAEGKQVEVHYDIDEKLPIKLSGDEKRIKQVLLNIAGNAIKFTEAGEIVIKCKILNEYEDVLELGFDIQDTGVGLSPEKLEQINKFFAQNQLSNRSNYSGVGLTLSNELVNLMHGKIRADSIEGEGSTFSFSIIINKIKDDADSLINLKNNKNLNVLVVDDNKTCLSIISTLAEQLNWVATTANSATEAMQILESGKHFDLALIDWNMPETDGWQLAKQLRSSDALQADIPLVIMITAYTRQMLAQKHTQEPEKLLNGFLTKPVTKLSLLDAVSDAVFAQNITQPTDLNLGLRLVDKRILLVEDNPINQTIAQNLLSSEGAHVVVSSGGLQAIEELENSIIEFDLVLMDIQMPDMDGYETTRKIRSNYKFYDLPILALTSNVLNSDKIKCFEVGMNGHIAKPYELNTLVSMILQFTENTLDKRHNKVGHIADIAAKYQIDLDTTLERFNHSYPLLLKSLLIFLTDLYICLDEIQDKNKVWDETELKMFFHTLKGTSASFGLTQLSEKSELFEKSKTRLVELDNDAKFSQFLPILNASISAVEHLVESLKNIETDSSEQPALPNEEFQMLLEILSDELSHSKMHAIDTYKQVSINLRLISMSQTDVLLECLNKLEFKKAKVIVDEFLVSIRNKEYAD
ncbi:response regulator [Catenovulum maritimum]|nr:response regulator [Catenovulum maritimum]